MKLFEATKLGKLNLKNHVVMAPLTRSRAPGNIPNEMMAQYYAQRAGAGLIIAEGTSPSPNGLGYPRIPGAYSVEQSVGWKAVTKAVHDKGGAMFLQLMHTGRVSHPANLPEGAKHMAPSAIGISGQMYTDTMGMQNYPVPQEMTAAEVQSTIQEYIASCQLAVDSGFDGVELHAANGYLIDQFLNPAANQRKDNYGGSAENRMRFVLETAQGAAAKIGGDRLGIRVSPYGAFNDMGAFEGIDDFYTQLATELSKIGLVYMHIVDHSSMGAPPVSAELKMKIRKAFKGSLILSGGYDATRAEHDLVENKCDLVAFGRPFISNPNLIELMKNNKPLKQADPSTFYTPGAKGYTDY